jgi:hypothetical protein
MGGWDVVKIPNVFEQTLPRFLGRGADCKQYNYVYVWWVNQMTILTYKIYFCVISPSVWLTLLLCNVLDRLQIFTIAKCYLILFSSLKLTFEPSHSTSFNFAYS